MNDDLIVAATAKHGLPAGLLSALIQHESNDDPNAVGDNGLARGLGQMHAAACATVGADWGRMFDPAAAIDASAAYLAFCFKLTADWKWALAAYNQGPTVISRALHYAEAVEALV